MSSKPATFEYRDYIGSIEISLDDKCLYGKIMYIRDLITYEADTLVHLEERFRSAVDDYLELCEELERQPDRPFSGTFNIRIEPNLHRRISMVAYRHGISLNAAVAKAVREYTDSIESKKSEDHAGALITIGSLETRRSNTAEITWEKVFEGNNHEGGNGWEKLIRDQANFAH